MAQSFEDNIGADISQEFIDVGREQSRSRRKGGPYSKDEKIKRQNEVHRLHFE